MSESSAQLPRGSFSSRRKVLMGGLAGAAVIGSSAWHQAILNDTFEADWAKLRRARGALPVIPVFDARDVGPVGHATARRAQVEALRLACIGPLTPLLNGMAYCLDELAGRWINACHSPYADELRQIAAKFDAPGVYLINSSYEWGCTALAAPAEKGDSAVLLRTLDWPFNGLGKYAELVIQKGVAGAFYNVTWPGAVGVLTAMAPGRFAASINQAPVKRQFKADSLAFLDSPLNISDTYFNITDPPAMHVFRRVFEEAKNFTQARQMLETLPIANPAIFTLVGTAPGETCVIERDRQLFKTKMGVASAANDWRYSSFPGTWLALGADKRDPRGDNPERSAFIESFAGQPLGNFNWVKAPILNGYTRLAVEANPKLGHIRVRGYEENTDNDSASPVTAILDFQT